MGMAGITAAARPRHDALEHDGRLRIVVGAHEQADSGGVSVGLRRVGQRRRQRAASGAQRLGGGERELPFHHDIVRRLPHPMVVGDEPFGFEIAERVRGLGRARRQDIGRERGTGHGQDREGGAFAVGAGAQAVVERGRDGRVAGRPCPVGRRPAPLAQREVATFLRQRESLHDAQRNALTGVGHGGDEAMRPFLLGPLTAAADRVDDRIVRQRQQRQGNQPAVLDQRTGTAA